MDNNGLSKSIEYLEHAQVERDKTIIRLWKAVESKVSIKMFLSILGIAVMIEGLIIGALFYNQDHLLTAMMQSQSATLDKVMGMKVDIEIIKQQMRLSNCQND